MRAKRIAIMLDDRIVRRVDRLIKQGRYPNRSQAIQAVLRDRLGVGGRDRLVIELAKIDPKEEQAMAEERSAGGLWAKEKNLV
jgi:Arc/MetJ-type ribon-helix-helix transcriptional regulator